MAGSQVYTLLFLAFLSFVQIGYAYPCPDSSNPEDCDDASAVSKTTTNNTVHFNLTLTWEDWSVAGKTRKMILTNGQFPAPTLRLKQGDDVEVLVNNSLPFSTTVHFHGGSPSVQFACAVNPFS